LVVQEIMAEDWLTAEEVTKEITGAVVSTGGATELLTVTLMLVVAVLFAASLATTVIV